MVDRTGRENNKEIGLHIIPAHAAETAHLGAHRLRINLEFDHIAQLDIEPVGIVLFDRHETRLDSSLPPLAAGHAVIRGQLGGPSDLSPTEATADLAFLWFVACLTFTGLFARASTSASSIRLALPVAHRKPYSCSALRGLFLCVVSSATGKRATFGIGVKVFLWVGRCSINLGDARAYKRVERIALHPIFFKEFFNAGNLRLRNIHHKMIWRILRKLSLPVCDEVGAQQSKNKQRHNCHRKHHHLKDVLLASAACGAHRKLPRAACSHTHRTARTQQQKRQTREENRNACNSDNQHRGEYRVLAIPIHQTDCATNAENIGHIGTHFLLANIFS